MAAKTRLRLCLLVIVVATVGCDHATKHIATDQLAGGGSHSLLGDTIRLEYTENTGAFLSLGANWPAVARIAVFTIGNGLLLLTIAWAVIRRPLDDWRWVGLSLFVAGGVSNWIDRVATGRVVDFLNVGVGPVRTGIFNFADVIIMIGLGLNLVAEYRGTRRGAPAGKATERE